MRRLWALAVLALVSCRSEHIVSLADGLEADVRTPPAGMIQLLGPSVTVRYRGRTIVQAPALYSIDVGDSLALRDDVNRRVIIVRPDGQHTEVRCDGGTSLAPERFIGIDCWRGRTTTDFAVVRYASTGEVVHTYAAPARADCGLGRVSYIGYEEHGEPIVGYECLAAGRRVCRAASLGEPERDLDERPASTQDVDCGYVLRTEGARRYADVRRWAQVK